MKIALAGFQHETNSFSPILAKLKDFEQADGWPPLLRGHAMLEGVAGYKIPIAGFLGEARGYGWQLAPLLWCSAQPSGLVEKHAYETIAGWLIKDLKKQLPVDGIYLDLHGAMMAEHVRDGEGELLRRVREAVGNAPVVVSLDLHANVSAQMVEQSDALVAFRTYPHTDMVETGARAAKLLQECIGRNKPFAKAFRQPDFLIPVPAQSTLAEPAGSIYREMQKISASSLSFTQGFPLADMEATGPAVMAYADTESQAAQAADQLLAHIHAARSLFCAPLLSPQEGVSAAKTRYQGKPIILADTADNPGAGGSSDEMSLFRELVTQRAEGAVAAMVLDPNAAMHAHEKGAGVSAMLKVSDFEGEFRIEALGDGHFTATGPMYGGNTMQLGKMALLEHGGVRVIVCSVKQQAATRAIFHHLGLNPEEQKILALKSSVHFRADFADIAGEILVVEGPGLAPSDPRKLNYRFATRKSA